MSHFTNDSDPLGIEHQEAAAQAACWYAARAHGLTMEEADACDNMERGCPTCPWREHAHPRFFTRIGGFNGSDALYVRYDTAEAAAVVVTPTGERSSNHGPWPLSMCLMLVGRGEARELTADEARAIAPHGVPEPDHHG